MLSICKFTIYGSFWYVLTQYTGQYIPKYVQIRTLYVPIPPVLAANPFVKPNINTYQNIPNTYQNGQIRTTKHTNTGSVWHQRRKYTGGIGMYYDLYLHVSIGKHVMIHINTSTWQYRWYLVCIDTCIRYVFVRITRFVLQIRYDTYFCNLQPQGGPLRALQPVWGPFGASNVCVTLLASAARGSGAMC